PTLSPQAGRGSRVAEGEGLLPSPAGGGRAGDEGVMLNGVSVATIHADLTSGDGLNLTLAKPLQANAGVAFIGTQKNGAFDISGELARHWLTQPNPNGRPNSNVIRPWSNGMDITRRPSDTWIIDFGVAMSEQDAAMFELPFQYAEKHIKPVRTGKRHTRASELWWIHECARPGLRNALNSQSKFIGTPRVAKHRLFTWLNTSLLPDCQVVAIARSDDTTFGILHSRFHELWSLRMGTSLEDRPRYTPSTTFETFPFPVGANLLAQETSRINSTLQNPQNDAIAAAAKALNQLRENWLNPAEWVDWLRTPEEQQAGYPLRPVAKPAHEAELKKRTLTNLYNARPAWLSNAHQVLDAAVAAAYGWEDYTPAMPDEEILRRLLALNLERAV
ncbi:MAG: hypothetical protein PXX73_09700, partial [Sideroxydans sp.]|nr:hypothetical protein [Sideroxydans sp.]